VHICAWYHNVLIGNIYIMSVIGIDEVGRGCWAGPLLVVASRARGSLPSGLADSKVLSKAKRVLLIDSIVDSCDIGEGWVSPEEIDSLGLAGAMKIAVSRALKELKAESTEAIMMDGLVNYCPSEFINVQTVAKADQKYPIVSASSIYAKVTRDNYMAQESIKYPNYGFESHVGYGTKAHNEALKTYGVCDLHRKSFKPVKAYL